MISLGGTPSWVERTALMIESTCTSVVSERLKKTHSLAHSLTYSLLLTLTHLGVWVWPISPSTTFSQGLIENLRAGCLDEIDWDKDCGCVLLSLMGDGRVKPRTTERMLRDRDRCTFFKKLSRRGRRSQSVFIVALHLDMAYSHAYPILRRHPTYITDAAEAPAPWNLITLQHPPPCSELLCAAFVPTASGHDTSNLLEVQGLQCGRCRTLWQRGWH